MAREKIALTPQVVRALWAAVGLVDGMRVPLGSAARSLRGMMICKHCGFDVNGEARTIEIVVESADRALARLRRASGPAQSKKGARR